MLWVCLVGWVRLWASGKVSPRNYNDNKQHLLWASPLCEFISVIL